MHKSVLSCCKSDIKQSCPPPTPTHPPPPSSSKREELINLDCIQYYAIHTQTQENGYSYVEMNASSTRNKCTLHDEVTSQLSCLSLGALRKGCVSSGRRHALIMDEVDGMAGNEDRGGMQVQKFKVCAPRNYKSCSM